MSALAKIEAVGPMNSLGMDLPQEQSFEEWYATGQSLARGQKALNWWIGDWWAAGSHRYGQRAAAAAQGLFGVEFGALSNMASVCRSFETSRRREVLTFSHHAEVASLPPEKADQLLDQAIREGWSTRDIRAAALAVKPHVPRWFEAKPRTVFDREEAKEAIFNRLSQAAEMGQLCPTADDLAEVSGVSSVSTTVALMHSLESEGRIEVQRYQKSRQVMITASGLSTAPPANTAPHWRERSESVPAPAIHSIRQKEQKVSEAIETEARRLNVSLSDFLSDLVYIGWHEYLDEKERDA